MDPAATDARLFLFQAVQEIILAGKTSNKDEEVQ